MARHVCVCVCVLYTVCVCVCVLYTADADIGPEWKVRELHVSGDYPITSAVLLSLPRLSDTAARLHLNLGQHGRMLITVDRPEASAKHEH